MCVSVQCAVKRVLSRPHTSIPPAGTFVSRVEASGNRTAWMEASETAKAVTNEPLLNVSVLFAKKCYGLNKKELGGSSAVFPLPFFNS